MSSRRQYPVHPLVGVGALIHKDGKLLLIKRKFEPNRGRWSLPGGLLETGETLEEGAKREVREEVGLEIAVEGVYQVSDEIIPDSEGKTRFHFVLVDYLARPMGEKVTLNEESDEFGWFEPRSLLELDLSKNTRAIIGKFMREHSAHG